MIQRGGGTSNSSPCSCLVGNESCHKVMMLLFIDGVNECVLCLADEWMCVVPH